MEEAVQLRREGIQKPILILGYTFPSSYETLADLEVRPAVFRRDMLEQLSGTGILKGRKLKVHIKVDTGMNRIGITPDEEGLDFIRCAMGMPGIEIEGVFTHFARADEADKTDAYEQLEQFEGFLNRIGNELGLRIPMKHCSNSASLMEIPRANMDAVRPGIILYGVAPSEEVDKERIRLRPALTLHSHIVYVKTLEAGQSVSYGGTFTASDRMRVATIPVGYGDGYPRSLSNKGYVLIHGRRAAILGRICMDQFMVDVTKIPQVREGDPVTLIGTEGSETITAESLGELSGRFSYELLCDLGKRIPRVYLKEGKLLNENSQGENP